ncbi:formylmethanofuran--tetrahydromethanopterin N-formyltransferase [Methanococcus voltae]|uniref:Formylmethanofuran--tetrahydromethanopterin formyltransferase n=1 Tax=Methanococcus voltae TaxID=2188 RepID=A0A8J7RJ14_METVO|nr:formylmethanofuran--tetrahydromethanopterin N-formyltransferase [Methanococcus voltae]MBP2201791.1 formylmethanofuran--tetrahydromethanopterin N-formyltransferase [Methanococcus voltae]
MELNGVAIDNTFAEGFPIWTSRVLITAATERLAKVAATEATGFACSVIMCPAEAGIEKYVAPTETPDGRPGYIVEICHPKKSGLEHQLLERLGQCVLTAPTTAVYDAMGEDAEEQLKIGFKLKFFGDGYETKEKTEDGKVIYAVPIMGGDFKIESKLGIKKGVAGGNFFIMADSNMAALNAAEVAVDAIYNVEKTITPFPGGIVASGSKVGYTNPKYSFMAATTNEKMCPTLKDSVESSIPEDVNGVYEIVIDGVDEEAVKAAMKAGIAAATKIPGVKQITAGNYGGKLGKYQIQLQELF